MGMKTAMKGENMGARQAHVGLASLNQTVGDWAGNEARIRQVIEARRGRGQVAPAARDVRARLQPGRPPAPGGHDRAVLGPDDPLADATEGMAVAVGLPIQFEGVLYNAMALLANGKLVGLAAKENLATGDVEYENRYFLSWPHGRLVDFRGPDGTTAPLGTQMFQLPGLGMVAFEICEDAWKGLRPGSTYRPRGGRDPVQSLGVVVHDRQA